MLRFELRHQLKLQLVQPGFLFLRIVLRVGNGKLHAGLSQPTIQPLAKLGRPPLKLAIVRAAVAGFSYIREHIILFTRVGIEVVQLVMTVFVVVDEFPWTASDDRRRVAALVSIMGIMPKSK